MPNAGEYIRSTDIPTVTGVNATLATGSLTATFVDIPGCSLTVNAATGGANLLVTGTFDFECTSFTSSDVLLGRCLLDGVAQSAQAVYQISGSNQRATITQVWFIPVAAGARVVKLQAAQLFAGVSAKVNSGNSVITATLFNKGS